MARRRFFVEAVRGGRAQITGPDAHHLKRVLRVELGQQFEISDNANVYLAEVESARKDLVAFRVLEPIAGRVMPVRILLFAALFKFERFEWMLEKATELGVEQITAVETERAEKGLARAAEKRLPRWRRIAREASEQSRRDRLPEIASPVSLADALRTNASYRYVLDESETKPILGAFQKSGAGALARAEPPGSALGGGMRASLADQGGRPTVAVLAGSEGGWTDRERARIVAAQWTPVSLGPSILRAETAAIAGIAVLNAAYSVF